MSHLTDLTSHCIRCGFCLESCPTFILSGEETEGPRGRIYLVRSAEEGVVEWESIRPHLDHCLGCRACETACPSGVEYGQIFELARDRLEREKPNFIKKSMLAGMTSPTVFRNQLGLTKLTSGKVPGVVLKPIQLEDGPITMPKPQPDRFKSLHPQKVLGDVDLLEGCAMRVLFPGVHTATRNLLARLGFAVRDREAGCCGALHAHNGQLGLALERVEELAHNLKGDGPIVVNSAGCGSWLKEQPALAGRVVDISEFLLEQGMIDLLRDCFPMSSIVTYHDACHLAHGQKIRLAPRTLMEAVPGLRTIDLQEADMCCGSAGIYNVTNPVTARELRDRKWRNIESTGADAVVMGNPGCHAWLLQAARDAGSKIKVLHLAELLELVFPEPR